MKNSLINPDLLKLLFLKLFPLDLPRIQLFFRNFRFCFYFISKKCFTVIRKVLVFVISALLITKAVLLFIPNQAYRKIMLLIIWLSFNIHFLCLKINFWDGSVHDFFFLFLFMKDSWFEKKGVWFALTHHLFMRACFFKSCFGSIKLNTVILRSHSNSTILNVRHKCFIRKVSIFQIRENVWFWIEYLH